MANKQCEICDREIIRYEQVPPMLEPVCVLCADVVRAYMARDLVYQGNSIIERLKAQGNTFNDIEEYVPVALHNAGLDNEDGAAHVAKYFDKLKEQGWRFPD